MKRIILMLMATLIMSTANAQTNFITTRGIPDHFPTLQPLKLDVNDILPAQQYVPTRISNTQNTTLSLDFDLDLHNLNLDLHNLNLDWHNLSAPTKMNSFSEPEKQQSIMVSQNMPHTQTVFKNFKPQTSFQFKSGNISISGNGKSLMDFVRNQVTQKRMQRRMEAMDRQR